MTYYDSIMKTQKPIKILIICLFWLQACSSFRVEIYLISAEMKPQWITIEHENSKCQSLKEGLFSQEFVIPESGFLCTSDSLYKGWSLRRYFLVNEKRERTPLKIKQHIWREGAFYVNESSLEMGQSPCRVVADEFFYGSKDGLTYENPIMENEIFLKAYHPECRHRGTGRRKNGPLHEKSSRE